MPYPYTAPCVKGLFDDLYYWDTYFINKGLLIDNYIELAKNNILDMSFLIKKYGYMPNSANYGLLNRSQVPLFSMMCDDFFEKTKDLEFVKNILPSMKIEFDFWLEKRTFKNGVFHYGNNATDEFKTEFANEFKKRVLLSDENRSDLEIGDNALAECESGWDFSPRFNHHALDFAPIDLNSIMYKNAMIINKFYTLLNIKEDKYLLIADKIKKFILTKMIKDDVYYDFDVVNNEHSSVVSCASFLAFALGIDDNLERFRKNYKLLNFEYGIAATVPYNSENRYQWAYPNIWAPLVTFAFMAAINLKDFDSATKIATSYVLLIEKEYGKNNALWEKYDAVCGSKSKVNEYQETEMLGWTAGTYVLLEEYLRHGKEN